ncbi:MAG: serine/threonine-protein kinase [Myxococcales bacterium]|nr:serine/threonine-protein kinase [Myxococcales bacterium]
MSQSEVLLEDSNEVFGDIAGRYRLLHPIGRGGVAVVYEATDGQTDRRIALKRMLPQSDAHRRERWGQLFEREYHTLCQLSHPRVVEVYDYGLDDAGPYYTMELLDGGDLQALSPLGWRKACAVARDICSALSLLHSRRQVHRDITPRNIRCTADGLAKLIDFGAMTPVGVARFVVGTPPFCAPEALQREQVDRRTDLFSLGATLYYALTGRHAYPARSFSRLHTVWQTPFAHPSQLVDDIPQALDSLVLDLLRLEPDGRPASAGEVMERLAAVERVALEEHLFVAQAYFSTPTLVGRDAQRGRIRQYIQEAREGAGCAILIQGGPGVGRSRLLDACAMDARTRGLTVLRANAEDASEGEYGAVRALLDQLFESLPELTERVVQRDGGMLSLVSPTVRKLIPAVQAPAQATSAAEAEQQRPEIQAALQRLLLSIAAERPLLIAVDDLHDFDEPSAAMLAVLADQLEGHPLALVASRDTTTCTSTTTALGLLAARAEQITLQPLDQTQARALLTDIFGEVPHLDMLAHRIYTLSNGNPKDMMHLAQHLRDRGVVRYHGGVWSLPSSIDSEDLPTSVAQAMRDRLEQVSEGARQLGRAFGLRPELWASFDDCLALCGHGDTGRLQGELGELIAADVLKVSGEEFALTRRHWCEPLLQGTRDNEQQLHQRLAVMFEQRGDETFRAALHRMRAGELDRALDMLVEYAEASQRLTETAEEFRKLVYSLPDDWYEIYDQAVSSCERLGRPGRDKYALQSRLAGTVAVYGVIDDKHLPPMLEQLAELAGLRDWEQLDASMDPMARIVQALQQAQARFDQAPPEQRVLDPASAIKQLARAVIQVGSIIAGTFDLPYLLRLPSLEPLAQLSPAISVIQTLLCGMRARMTAHQDTRKLYYEVLRRTAEPDRAGFDEGHHRYLRLGVRSGIGLTEAGMGLRSCLEQADHCALEPFYQANALQMRMIHDLWQGDIVGAERNRREVEVLRIRNWVGRLLEGTHLIWQLTALTLSDDLTHTKECLNEVDGFAEQHPNWRPIRHFGHGELHRIRGDYGGAVSELGIALDMTAAGDHQIWPYAAGAMVRALLLREATSEAVSVGFQALEAAEQAELGFHLHYIRMPLAVALSGEGRGPDAVEHAERVIAEMLETGSTGLNLGLAYETRAQVAMALGNEEDQARYAEKSYAAMCAHGNPALEAKLARLGRRATRKFVPPQPVGSTYTDHSQLSDAECLSQVDACEDRAQRIQCALIQLARRSGSAGGALYTVVDGTFSKIAELGVQPNPSVDALARVIYEEETSHCGDTETASAAILRGETAVGPQVDGRYFPVVLRHTTARREVSVTAVAMLRMPGGIRFECPAALAVQLSERLHELGDLSSASIMTVG